MVIDTFTLFLSYYVFHVVRAMMSSKDKTKNIIGYILGTVFIKRPIIGRFMKTVPEALDVIMTVKVQVLSADRNGSVGSRLTLHLSHVRMLIVPPSCLKTVTRDKG